MSVKIRRQYSRSFVVVFILIALFMIVFEFSGTCGLERELTYTLNPGCGIECNVTGTEITVVHVSAIGPNDTLHYVWDFVGKPSVLVALTSHNANLSINWLDFINGLENTVNFSEPPKYTFGIVLNKIVEFNDVEDIGRFNKNDSYIRNLCTEYFNWKRTSLVQDEQGVVLNIEANGFYYNDTFTRSGHLRIKLEAFGFRKHSKELPRLLHTANTTVIDLEIDGLETSFANSRFGVEILLASSDNASKKMAINERLNLDDEESPGEFTLVDLLTPSSASPGRGGSGGWLQWRPVAYVARLRSLTSSTETLQYDVAGVADPTQTLNNTLMYSYYGYNLVGNTLVQQTTVTFGIKKDGFFQKTKFTSWAFSVGYGQPPSETFSLLVILVISIGLGLPAVLMLASGLVLCNRRLRRNKDELCLGR